MAEGRLIIRKINFVCAVGAECILIKRLHCRQVFKKCRLKDLNEIKSIELHCIVTFGVIYIFVL